MEHHDDGGYQYHVKEIRGNVTFIECSDRRASQCGAHGKISEGEITWILGHNHVPDRSTHIKREFKNKLRVAVLGSFTDYRSIYNNIAKTDVIGASLVPFVSVERSMLRWRRTVTPQVPTTLPQLSDILNGGQHEHLLDYAGGKMHVMNVEATDGSMALVMFDPAFINSLPNIEELCVDGTFKVCPRKPSGIYQLTTIMVRVFDNVIPICWAFSEKKTEAAYDAIFSFFSQHLAPHMQPILVTMDFEVALGNAISTAYPDARICRCYFHYLQALSKRLKKKGAGLFFRLKDWHEGQVFYRKIAALPLLPAEQIARSYQWIVDNASSDITYAFRDLLQYYPRWWLGRVKPAQFSVYRLMHRTNGNMEAFHRVLHQLMGEHPSIWAFIDCLKGLLSTTRAEFMSLSRGIPIRRPITSHDALQEAIISRAWNLLDSGELDCVRFLACANHFSCIFENDVLITDVEQVNTFVDARTHRVDVHETPPREITIPDHELGTIPIMLPRAQENGLVILILRDLEYSRCTLCNDLPACFVCVPCWHWFGCTKCTIELVNMATQHQAVLQCHVCNDVSLAFQKLYVT